jgi:hypothetical protein
MSGEKTSTGSLWIPAAIEAAATASRQSIANFIMGKNLLMVRCLADTAISRANA